MTWDVWLVGGIVSAAGVYLAWTLWRTVAGQKKGCGSGCGKCATTATAAKGRISLPQV